MKKFYFTFGVGDPLYAHKFVVFETNDYEKARERMFELFGNKWAFDYDDAHWNYVKGSKEWQNQVALGNIAPDDPRDVVSQADIWHLTELKLPD